MTHPAVIATTLDLPVGTVTFLRSDVEGSMDLVRSLGTSYDEFNAQHQAIVRDAILGQGGQVVRTEGDAFFAVFTDTVAAARTAQRVQRTMATHPWPSNHAFRVRIGLHAGTAYRAGDDYGGLEVSRASRIAGLGAGGQIILSAAVRVLLTADHGGDWAIRDLGLHRLKGVAEPEPIFQLDVPGLAAEFPPLRSGASPGGHLPRRMKTLIGRESELQTLGQLLEATRLLTLTGPGGTGKTTLAIELARRHTAGYRDAAWFVDLQAVRDPTLVRAEIAHGLGIFDGATGPAADRLASFVSDRELLIILDNFEQLIDATDAVRDLIDASPRSRIIATSRIPLRLSAEQEYPVRPLSLEPMDGADTTEAARLFVNRARRVRPELSLGDEDLDAIHEVCRRLDGLPLAIELCAARVSGMPIGLIRDRVEARLPLPGSAGRDLPARQRTIEATVAWSYDLLEAPLQRLFARLSVFAETFDLEQADEVAGSFEGSELDVLDGLYALVERSLLLRADDSVGGVRFGMLETIHAFAAAQLESSAEEQALRERHARAFAALATRAGEHIPGPDQAQWLDRLEADASNLRTATTFAIDAGDVDLALRLVGHQWRSWLATGRLVEGRELVAAVLALPGADGAGSHRIWALDAAGGIAYWSGDLAQATSWYEQQVALANELGDVLGQAWSSYNLYCCRSFSTDRSGASEMIEAARRHFERLDDHSGLAMIEEAQSQPLLADAIENPEGARPKLEAALATYEARADHDPRQRTRALETRLLLDLLSGDASGAARAMVATVPTYLAKREPANVALGLRLVPAGLLASGLAVAAGVVYGGVMSASERLGIAPDFVGLDAISPDPMPALLETLGPDGVDAAMDRGRRMSLEELIEFIEATIGEPAAV